MKPDTDALLEGFSGSIPVFPLPNVVLFPGAILPLHVFEPRYQQMVADVLAGNGMMAMGLLKQCSQKEYEDRPPFHDTICVGTLVHHEPLPDGHSRVALLGLSAATATRRNDDQLYRATEAELLADEVDFGEGLDGSLAEVCSLALRGADVGAVREQLGAYLLDERLPQALLNTCALAAPLLPAHKLELLEERSLARRLSRLRELLQRPWQWN